MELSHEKAAVYRCAIEVYKSTLVSTEINKVLQRALKRRTSSLLQHAAVAARFAGTPTGAQALHYARDAATKIAAIGDALRVERQITSDAHRRMRAALIVFERAMRTDTPGDVGRSGRRARPAAKPMPPDASPSAVDFVLEPVLDVFDEFAADDDGDDDDDGRPPDTH